MVKIKQVTHYCEYCWTYLLIFLPSRVLAYSNKVLLILVTINYLQEFYCSANVFSASCPVICAIWEKRWIVADFLLLLFCYQEAIILAFTHLKHLNHSCQEKQKCKTQIIYSLLLKQNKTIQGLVEIKDKIRLQFPFTYSVCVHLSLH